MSFVTHLIPVLITLYLLSISSPVIAVETTSGEDGSILPAILSVLAGALIIASSVILGLIVWRRKQEEKSDMLLLCMKFLPSSKDENERRSSAMALANYKNSGALLVLLDVFYDDHEPPAVRDAAQEALEVMKGHSRKFKKVLEALEHEAEKGDSLGVIAKLISSFEMSGKKYVQSACLIGRQYARLDRHIDARLWFEKACIRNQGDNLYGNRIDNWIRQCNLNLLDEADSSFKAAEYQQAKEHYAALDHGLNNRTKRLFSIYLRTACTYCKLHDYERADQAILAALHREHGTDEALILVPLLRKLIDEDLGSSGTRNGLALRRDAIEKHSSEIMERLFAQGAGY